MKRTIALILGGITIAVISMGIGAGATFLYLAKPMEKWGMEFSETYLPMQSDALQALRLGKQEPALLYLETVSTFSINELQKQRAESASTPRSLRTEKAIEYLCANPPVIPGATSKTPSSIAEACSNLQKYKTRER
jgi:hypothetical protein